MPATTITAGVALSLSVRRLVIMGTHVSGQPNSIERRHAMADLNPAQVQDERERVRATLATRATGKCPRCNGADFTLLDGFLILPLSPRSNRAVLGGKTLT